MLKFVDYKRMRLLIILYATFSATSLFAQNKLDEVDSILRILEDSLFFKQNDLNYLTGMSYERLDWNVFIEQENIGKDSMNFAISYTTHTGSYFGSVNYYFVVFKNELIYCQSEEYISLGQNGVQLNENDLDSIWIEHTYEHEGSIIVKESYDKQFTGGIVCKGSYYICDSEIIWRDIELDYGNEISSEERAWNYEETQNLFDFFEIIYEAVVPLFWETQ